MKNHIPTITIGIPAHNEENTIGDLIASIFSQRGNFIIENILVFCDGCADNTAKVIQDLNDPRIILYNDGKRLGKSARLNQIYQKATSDMLVTLDADLLLHTVSEFDKMLTVFKTNSKAVLVAGNIVLTHPERGFVPKMLQINHELWARTTQSYKSGRNIHTSHGQAYMMHRSFYTTFRLPKHVTCDQGFLYVAAQPDGYYFAHKTIIMGNPVDNLSEIQVGHTRTMNEREDLVKYYGETILNIYHVPVRYRLSAIMSMLMKHPWYTSMAVLFNIWIRFAAIEDVHHKNGLWSISKSVKKKIVLS